MPHISAHVRLRPIRFAYLVRPDDHKRILEIFHVNTCLWGGKFNPIMPFFKRTPKWWDRHNDWRPEQASRILNGYLDFFEPDFIVEAEPGMAQGLGFDEDRVIGLSDILTDEDNWNNEGVGLSVFALYRELYRKEFQYTRRHKHGIIDVTTETALYEAFSACLFGSFPTDTDRNYIGQAFVDAFEPERISLNDKALLDLYKSGYTSALKLGHSEVEVTYHDRRGPVLFILDATDPKDLIDFWNLRIFRHNVVPVPIQWFDGLSEFCREYILQNHRPLPGIGHGVWNHTTVLIARSIPTSDIKQRYSQHLRIEERDALVHQDWYPAIWQPLPSVIVPEMRATLTGGKKTFDTTFDSERPQVRFDSLHPEFASRFGNRRRWANVVRLEDHTYKDQIATVFPENYRNPVFPRIGLSFKGPLPTTEGLVIFPPYINSSERWLMPDGISAIAGWLKENGIKTVPSSAGQTTQQIIQTLGGLSGVDSVAHPDIVKYLHEISRSPYRAATHRAFQQRIQNVAKQDFWRTGSLERLVEQGSVELGLEVRCTKCLNWNWYSLKELDYNLVCALCLRQYGFPIVDPGLLDKARWAYRLAGPFALPKYAEGGYASALSIRFFSRIISPNFDHAVTWSAGLELELEKNKKVESDYILWYQRREFSGNYLPVDIVFGEAKSFGLEAFQTEDAERMKQLALHFPGSILVFSTMKKAEDLSRKEISLLSKIARWGREYVHERRQTRAPVIILTGTELFSSASLRQTWQDLKGNHAAAIQHAMVHVENLRVLADLTQQLYLNLPPYWEWYEQRRIRRSRS